MPTEDKPCPYMKRIMEVLNSDSPAKAIVARPPREFLPFGLATAYIEALITADDGPAPILYVFKTKKEAEDRMAPMLELCGLDNTNGDKDVN